MVDKIFVLKCPKCFLPARAKIDIPCHRFIIYTCPRCRSNVVYYGSRVDIISDTLLKKLTKKRKIAFCGNVSFNSIKDSDFGGSVESYITNDDILNLKILLETEKNFSRLLSRL